MVTFFSESTPCPVFQLPSAPPQAGAPHRCTPLLSSDFAVSSPGPCPPLQVETASGFDALGDFKGNRHKVTLTQDKIDFRQGAKKKNDTFYGTAPVSHAHGLVHPVFTQKLPRMRVAKLRQKHARLLIPTRQQADQKLELRAVAPEMLLPT